MKLKGFLAILILVAAVVVILKQIKPVGDEGLMKKIQTVDTAKEQATRMNLKALQWEIVDYILAHGRAPENLKQLPQTAMLMIEKGDEWGTQIRYKRISDDSFHLISAGNDREFDTSDDIVLEY
jgi:hypothetical protein